MALAAGAQPGENIVALCDVDQAQFAAARKVLGEKAEGGAAAVGRAVRRR
jgi:hypothetical protein